MRLGSWSSGRLLATILALIVAAASLVGWAHLRLRQLAADVDQGMQGPHVPEREIHAVSEAMPWLFAAWGLAVLLGIVASVFAVFCVIRFWHESSAAMAPRSPVPDEP